MKVKQCQFSSTINCCNRGEACLNTVEERRKYNEIINQMQDKLESLKLSLDDIPKGVGNCSDLNETDEIIFEID